MIKISQNIEKFKKLSSVFYTILNISLELFKEIYKTTEVFKCPFPPLKFNHDIKITILSYFISYQ
jgi:hypothetical protein